MWGYLRLLEDHALRVQEMKMDEIRLLKLIDRLTKQVQKNRDTIVFILKELKKGEEDD